MNNDADRGLEPRQHGLISRQAFHPVASRHLQQDETIEPVYAAWQTHLGFGQINGLAGGGQVLWAATNGGVVCWQWRDGVIAYRQFGSEHGLVGSRFDWVVVDGSGRPWVAGTQSQGVGYFDGSVWQTVWLENCRPTMQVLGLTADPRETAVWVATNEGLGRIGWEAGEAVWSCYDVAAAGMPGQWIGCVAVGTAGGLALGTMLGLYLRLADGSWRHWAAADGLPDSHIRALAYDNTAYDAAGMLWVGTGMGVCCLTEGELLAVMPLAGEAVRGIATAAGVVWVLTQQGLWQWQGGDWQKRYRWGEGVSAARCVAAAESGVWAGFEHGLLAYEPEPQMLMPVAQQEMPTGSVVALAADEQRRVWAGTAVGIWRYEAGTWRRLRAGQRDLAEPLRQVQAMATFAGKGVWVGSWLSGKEGGLRQLIGGGSEMPIPKEGKPKLVEGMAFDAVGSLWVAAEGWLRRYVGRKWETPLELPDEIEWVTVLAVDGAGQLWLGTEAGLWQRQGEGWKLYLEGIGICSLAVGENGRLWVGSRDGLYLLTDGEPQQVTAVGTEAVLSVAYDTKRDCIWLGLEQGLAQWDGKDFNRWQAHDSGLAHNRVHALALDVEGMLWIGTASGISQFRPE
ncbi:MAG: hypothetical protein KDE56_00355 [Anaerolineales bacterium]|nr:hypothetical protein [Anaerolineales bacterium]